MGALSSCASTGWSASSIDREADKALTILKADVEDAETFLDRIPGYLVFPRIIKAGVAIGAETGEGVLRVGGQSVDYYRTSSASLGLQLGVQSKSMVIAFRTMSAIEQFRRSSGWTAGVDGSIALINVGAGMKLDTDTVTEPVTAIVFGSKGLMYNLTLEGTKFTKLSGSTTDLSPALPAAYFPSGVAPESEREAIDIYFGDRKLDAIEGIWKWGDSSFLIAIIRNDTGIFPAYDYLGVTIRSFSNGWSPGQVKLLMNASADPNVFTGANFGPTHDISNSPYILENPNVMKMSVFDGWSLGYIQTMVVREYPNNRNGLIATSRAAESQGTCFLVSTNGIAVTSHHVVDEATEISVILADGRQVPAVVAKQSSSSDIAILKLDAITPDYLSFGTAKSAQIGDEIFTIGFPSKSILGADAKFTDGSISALSGFQGDATHLQISVPVQPGNSGGPVVNYQGKVVGVIAATAAFRAFFSATGALPQNVNWAVKSEYVQPMIEETAPRLAATDRGGAIARVQKAVCQVIAVR